MHKSSIVVGWEYTDGKGNVRRVIDVGPQYKLYQGQESTECLRYRVIKNARGPHPAGSECNCTLTSFARWAQGAVN